ncbi:DJ-1/PfpI family protein [Echinimonas agarilytica]|uniref:DJ-1/PfpI family protein n=1 Tax=Echinimonas agarilytica TaxID=1215918 RepID=A0AA42B6D6_9GAMM|nr:DJ-1/PfpI family protein [Echinimonas agarilytica]MCM2678534.1 DJ-1/PfpI family protein [Echinimonas agarilytica]
MNVAIYIYENAEVLDFSGPYEVFSTASRVDGESPFNVFLVAQTLTPVSARAGFKVIPHFSIDDHPEIDVLITVGGVHLPELDKAEVIQWIGQQASKAKLVASVCTGVFLLAKAGVVTTEKVATHWQDIDDLKSMFPTLNVVDSTRWIDQGRVVTSGGISAGIDMSLHLVGRLHGLELATQTAIQMEFCWREK